MRLIDLPRTGSFRIALLFLGLFGIASAGVFGFLLLQTQQFYLNNVDDWLRRETPVPALVSVAEVEQRFADHAARSPAWPRRMFTLYDSAGQIVAGDRVALPRSGFRSDRPFFFTTRAGNIPYRFRGLAYRYGTGEIVLVASNMRESREFDEAFVRTVLRGVGLTALLGLIGATIVGVATVRRFDAAASAIQEIVRGDLSRRLPAGSTSSDHDRLVGVVNGMLDEIERLMSEVKGVCDGIAHDLRTPLTRMLAGLERAQRRAVSQEDYALAVDEAVVELRSVLRTFAAMLRIAEIEDGARRAGFQRVDLGEILQDVFDLYEPAAEQKSIELLLQNGTGDMSSSHGDAGLLFTALSNLVDNAIKFTPSGGRVEIGLHYADGSSWISVTDTGCGIGEDEREAVFRRFYRTETSRRSPGNGLGLALVAAIARLHDMTVTIEPRTPGTAVTLRGLK